MKFQSLSALALIGMTAVVLTGCIPAAPAADTGVPEASPTGAAEPGASEDSDAEQPGASEDSDAEQPGAAVETEATGVLTEWPGDVPVADGEEQDLSTVPGAEAPEGAVVRVWEMADEAAAEAYFDELGAAGFSPSDLAPAEYEGSGVKLFEGKGYFVSGVIFPMGSTVLLSVSVVRA